MTEERITAALIEGTHWRPASPPGDEWPFEPIPLLRCGVNGFICHGENPDKTIN